MSLGEKIYSLRKSKGLSQEKLAEQAGVSRQTVYKWESDYVQPNADNIQVLCEIFAVARDYFYDNVQTASKEVAIAKYEPKSGKILIACCVIVALMLIVSLFLTVFFGSICNSPNKGDYYNATVIIDYGVYIIMLIATVIFTLIEALLIALIIKRKSKCKSNSNKM